MDEGATGTLRTRGASAWLRRFSRTTPGLVAGLALALAAICVIAGLVISAQLDRQITAHEAILNRSEPLTYAAQNLHDALSAADAAATTSFLSGGVETQQMRQRYLQALADAAAALTDTTAGVSDARARAAMADISARLATYTALIEGARANNRQGFPVGSAYLREASTLMQTSLLPAAEKVYTDNLAAVAREQRAVGSLPIAGLGLLALTLVAIGAASLVLVRRTNRQFNIGLLVSAAAVVAVAVWAVAATVLASGDIDDSRTAGSTRFEQLAAARILAQQARTDENLQLISRGDISAGEKSFTTHLDELTTAVSAGPDAATDGVRNWAGSHRKQVAAYQSGDYATALAQAIGPDPAASAAQFHLVESSLADELDRTRSVLRDEVSDAGRWLAWSPAGTLILMTVAAAAAVAGLWPRLKEFL